MNAAATPMNPPRCIDRPSLTTHLHDTSTAHPSSLPTHPVPEFLCHVLSMVSDPALSHIISWQICDDETDPSTLHKGKIVIHCPSLFQSQVLGRYYRHSKFSSFQRQMNYFGFKKRAFPFVNGATGGVRGKLNACEFVNDKLGAEKVTLLALKKRTKRDNKDKNQPHDKQCSNAAENCHPVVAALTTDAQDAIDAAPPESSCSDSSLGDRNFINGTTVGPSSFQARMQQEQTNYYSMMCNPVSGLGGTCYPFNAQCIHRPQLQTQLLTIGGCTSKPSESTNANGMNNNFNSFWATNVPLDHLAFMNQMSNSIMYPQQFFVNQNTMSKPPFMDNNKNDAVNTNQATAVAAQEAKQSLLQAYQQSQLNLLLKQQMINNTNRNNSCKDNSNYSFSVPKQPQQTPASLPVHRHYPTAQEGPDNSKSGVASLAIPISVVAHPDDGTHPPPPPFQLQQEQQPISPNPIMQLAKPDGIINNNSPRQPPSAIPLPTSIDELFDDGSVCSELCDEEELKDADDCSLLSVELGLAG